MNTWIGSRGYLKCWVNGREKMLHECIWEQYHNCKKPNGFQIHHIDGNKQNNSIENLELVSGSIHRRVHANWVRDSNGMFIAKPCTKCNRILSFDNFYERRGYGTPSALCKQCHVRTTNYAARINPKTKERAHKWYLKNKIKIKNKKSLKNRK